MATGPRHKLPKYIQFKHGSYWYVRWSAADKKVKWERLGDTYARMLIGLAERQDGDARTMDPIFDRYLREVASKKARFTFRARRWQIAVLKRSFGEMLPEAITPQHVYRFMDEYSAKAPISANSLVGLLRHVFVKAIRWGYVTSNPAASIEKNPEPPRNRYITDAEYELLRQRTPDHVRRAIELAYLTGQRIGDLLVMRWSQVRDDGIHITQQKTGSKVIVERSLELDAVLDQCRQMKVMGATVLVNAHGRQFSYYNITNPFRKVVKTLMAEGLVTERLTFHDLRRKAGSDVDAESELLGHIDSRTRNRVYRVKPRRAKPTR